MPIKERAMQILDELDEKQLEFAVNFLNFLRWNGASISDNIPNAETMRALDEAMSTSKEEMPVFSGSTSDFLNMLMEDEDA